MIKILPLLLVVFGMAACQNAANKPDPNATTTTPEAPVKVVPDEPKAIYEYFVNSLKANDYQTAQTCLHSNGVYFFTLPKLAVNQFTAEYLSQQKSAIYAYVEDDPKEYKTGTQWVNYALNSFNKYPASVSDNFQAGLGPDGNMTSDHLTDKNIEKGYFKDGSMILSINSNDTKADEVPTLILLVEFVKDNGKWRIYAVGDWQWTP